MKGWKKGLIPVIVYVSEKCFFFNLWGGVLPGSLFSECLEECERVHGSTDPRGPLHRSTAPRVHVARSQLIAYYLREPSRETKKHPSVIILAVHESGPRVGSTRQEKNFSASNKSVMFYDFYRRFSETEEKFRASNKSVMFHDFHRSNLSTCPPIRGREKRCLSLSNIEDPYSSGCLGKIPPQEETLPKKGPTYSHQGYFTCF